MKQESQIKELETGKDNPSSSSRLVSVAVPLGAGSLFSYEVPESLEDLVNPGGRVLVQFGNRHLVGLITGYELNSSVKKIKPILSVLDRKPVMPENLLQLGKWLAWYYMAPPGEMYRCMLPPGLLAKKASPDDTFSSHWPVREQDAVTAVNVEVKGALTKRQDDIFQRLIELKLPLLKAGLARKLGCSEGLLNTLRDKGVIQIEKIPVNRSPWDSREIELPAQHKLTLEQGQALEEINRLTDKQEYKSVLLHGVTASGKTEVYLRAIERVLDKDRTALTLVPEIGLTPQVSYIFRSWFGDKVAILHSRLSAGERFDQWCKIRNGDIRVVVGTRSAVFAPLKNLGLIIVDEEHDNSYKQGDQPRYNGRDTALKRGQIEGAVVILGSATPQLETYNNAVKKGLHHYIPMKKRILSRPLPEVSVVDMCEEFKRHGRGSSLSETLREKIKTRIEQGEQVLVFLNRRGYASMVLCRSCGYTECCENCSINLTYHQERNLLICHYCGFSKKAPRSCPECKKQYIHYHGEGTEKIQEELERLFPDAAVDRLDRDTTRRKGGFDSILGRFRRGETAILIGTQMIAKGHDFPGVTLVGVLNGDQGLGRPDFRAVERTFQLLTQVSGRAGRGEKPGEVVIQTFNPDHYGIKSALVQDFELFAKKELLTRRRFSYPPYVALANLVIKGKVYESVRNKSAELGRILRRLVREDFSDSGLRVFGPAPSTLERLEKEFRYQVILKSASRLQLHNLVEEAFKELAAGNYNTSGICVDIDPVDLM
jgi:primosomal protein N' (replication factor Y) (superfamily II helicase)